MKSKSDDADDADGDYLATISGDWATAKLLRREGGSSVSGDSSPCQYFLLPYA